MNELSSLKALHLGRTKVTEAGLKRLKGLSLHTPCPTARRVYPGPAWSWPSRQHGRDSRLFADPPVRECRPRDQTRWTENVCATRWRSSGGQGDDRGGVAGLDRPLSSSSLSASSNSLWDTPETRRSNNPQS